MAVQRLIRGGNSSYWLRLLCMVAAMGHSADCADPHTFSSDRFGYRLRVPSGWHVAVPPSGVPVFFNYDESESLPQGLIPDGGANIFLIPYEAVARVSRARDLQDWIRTNSEKWYTNVRSSRVAGWSSDGITPHEIVRVEADFVRDPEDEARQTEISYYFVLHGSGFRLRMLYGKGDPRSLYFRTVVETLLRSIKAL